MKRTLFALPLAMLLVTVGATTARADDLVSIHTLLERRVVSTASRSLETTAEAPAVSQSISSDQLRVYGVRSLDEALTFLSAGIYVQKGLGLPEVGARGVGFTADRNNHVLLLVDGHILNDQAFGGAQFGQGAGIPLELIDHIEVTFGPGSAVYGTNAVLAVINVVTKSASSLGGVHVAGELTLFSSGRMTATAGHSFDLLGKRTEIALGLSYYRFDGPTLTLNPQNVGIDATDGLPIRYRPNGPRTGIWGGRVREGYWGEVPAAQVRLTRGRLEVSARAVSASHADPGLAGDFDDPKMAEHERRVSISTKYRIPIGNIGESFVRGFYDHFDRSFHYISSRSCPFGNNLTCDHVGDTASERVGTEGQMSFDWLRNNQLTTIVHGTASVWRTSIETRSEDRFTGQELAPTSFTSPPTTHVMFAGSLQQTWRPFRWLSGNLGGRLDGSDRFPIVASPRATVALKPWSGATLKAIYAQAFRAPSDYEHDARFGVTIRARGLSPERVRAAEVAFEQEWDAHKVTFSIFGNDYQDAVRRVQLTSAETATAVAAGETVVPFSPDVQFFQLRNASNKRSYGFTTSIEGSALSRRLRAAASFTGSTSSVSGGEKGTVAPRAFGNGRVSYTLGGALPTVALAASFASKSIVDRAYDGGFRPTPFAPPQLELRATVTGDVPWIARLSYRVIVAHSFHDRSPYAIGPNKTASATVLQPELAPVQQWFGTVGLQYEF